MWLRDAGRSLPWGGALAHPSSTCVTASSSAGSAVRVDTGSSPPAGVRLACCEPATGRSGALRPGSTATVASVAGLRTQHARPGVRGRGRGRSRMAVGSRGARARRTGCHCRREPRYFGARGRAAAPSVAHGYGDHRGATESAGLRRSRRPTVACPRRTGAAGASRRGWRTRGAGPRHSLRVRAGGWAWRKGMAMVVGRSLKAMTASGVGRWPLADGRRPMAGCPWLVAGARWPMAGSGARRWLVAAVGRWSLVVRRWLVAGG